MSDIPGVSVIVPVFNGAATLPALLGGLRGQLPHLLGATEFLLVDNGSTDASRSLLTQSGLPGLTVLDEPQRGPSAARNRGLAVARGQIIALLDADCVPTRGWLRALVEPFADENVLIVAGGLASYMPRTGAQRFAAQYGMNDATRALHWTLPFANTRNMAVRTGAAREVGGWPEELTQSEDIEFSYRIRKRFGAQILLAESALAFHQDRESDEDLARQAYAYGSGTAHLYRRHAAEIAWTRGVRLHRRRRSIQRRLSAQLAGLRVRIGRASPQEAEFATYLALWDASFWRGFNDGWRAAQAQRG